MPRVSNFQVNANWQVFVGGAVVGELDALDFAEVCGVAEPGVPADTRKTGANGRRARSA